MLVEFLYEREDIAFFVDIFRYAKPDPRGTAESELTRYTSMEASCDRCEERSELLVISLTMDHHIGVALVTRDDDLEHRDDPMIVLVVTRIREYLLYGERTDAFGESVTFDGHSMEEVDQRK